MDFEMHAFRMNPLCRRSKWRKDKNERSSVTNDREQKDRFVEERYVLLFRCRLLAQLTAYKC